MLWHAVVDQATGASPGKIEDICQSNGAEICQSNGANKERLANFAQKLSKVMPHACCGMQ